jgi:hypothetical protein
VIHISCRYHREAKKLRLKSSTFRSYNYIAECDFYKVRDQERAPRKLNSKSIHYDRLNQLQHGENTSALDRFLWRREGINIHVIAFSRFCRSQSCYRFFSCHQWNVLPVYHLSPSPCRTDSPNFGLIVPFISSVSILSQSLSLFPVMAYSLPKSFPSPSSSFWGRLTLHN